jgi:competence protein ComEC
VALAFTAGIVLERMAGIPWPVTVFALVVALAGWVATYRGTRPVLALVYLWISITALGAVYHHSYRELYAADDIGTLAPPEPRQVKLRGVLDEEPAIVWQPHSDPLQSIPRSTDPTRAVLRVTELKQTDDWVAVSGRAQLVVAGHLQGLHVGDEVEVDGRLMAPHGPANPGEFDYAAHLRDQRIGAEVVVYKTPAGVTRLAEGWAWSFAGWLAVCRGWGQRALQEALPPEQSGVATALLLGKGSTMTHAEWDKYIRTGVIHVLAISGQHLIVLAAFLWWALRLAGIGRRRGAWLVTLFLLWYALLTGGEPPVMRSAVMVCVACGGIYLRRRVLPANSFALGWLTVAILNPTDLSTAGCQLSFLSVAILYWGIARWFRSGADPLRHGDEASRPAWKRGLGWLGLVRPGADPLERLIDESRPAWQIRLRWLCRAVATSYAVTLVIWLANAPLVASRYHMVSPVALLIGPPVVFLTSIALIAGFCLLLAAVVCWPLTPVCAWVTSLSLRGCELFVDWGDGLAGGHWYVGDVPAWWLWILYLVFLAVLTQDTLWRYWRWIIVAGVAWLCIGLISGPSRPPSDELRCTFVAVGHGGCTVLETPDGRTLLYDAGALGGPEVTQRQIAPFLWSRGVRRIDEVFLSHADLDHFNGIPALLERFAVGQVTCTPTFADKTAPGVQLTLTTIQRRGIPIRIVRAGDRLSSGAVEIEVLHPPAAGPLGNENTRSLVLLVRHADHTILLTGDLEGKGLDRVLKLPPPRLDVLMAPHHGSLAANTPELADWARPQLAVACEGPPRGPSRKEDPYEAKHIPRWGTWPHGAVTVRSRPEGLAVETFRTGQRLTLR